METKEFCGKAKGLQGERVALCQGSRIPTLTFSFLQAKAAALFSASALRRPLATNVIGQGQRRVRVDNLVLVPTVWNCIRFYNGRQRKGLKKQKKSQSDSTVTRGLALYTADLGQSLIYHMVP